MKVRVMTMQQSEDIKSYIKDKFDYTVDPENDDVEIVRQALFKYLSAVQRHIFSDVKVLPLNVMLTLEICMPPELAQSPSP